MLGFIPRLLLLVYQQAHVICFPLGRKENLGTKRATSPARLICLSLSVETAHLKRCRRDELSRIVRSALLRKRTARSAVDPADRGWRLSELEVLVRRVEVFSVGSGAGFWCSVLGCLLSRLIGGCSCVGSQFFLHKVVNVPLHKQVC